MPARVSSPRRSSTTAWLASSLRTRRRSGGSEPQQSGRTAFTTIFQHIELAARPLLHIADPLAHVPLFRLARLVATDANVHQCLSRQGGEEGIALPLREKVSRVDDSSGSRDRWIPATVWRLVAVPWAVLKDFHPVIVPSV